MKKFLSLVLLGSMMQLAHSQAYAGKNCGQGCKKNKTEKAAHGCKKNKKNKADKKKQNKEKSASDSSSSS